MCHRGGKLHSPDNICAPYYLSFIHLTHSTVDSTSTRRNAIDFPDQSRIGGGLEFEFTKRANVPYKYHSPIHPQIVNRQEQATWDQ